MHAISIERRDWADPHALVEEIARERRCDPLDAVCDVIIADKGATRIVVRSVSEADVRAIAADPSALVGSDGPCVAPVGIQSDGTARGSIRLDSALAHRLHH